MSGKLMHKRKGAPAPGWGALACALLMRGPPDEGRMEGGPLDEEGPPPASLSTALHAVAHAASWAEAPDGWASPPAPAEVETYAEALSLLAAACRSSAGTRDAVLRWEGPPKEAPKREGLSRGPPLLLHVCRVFCSLCYACLAEVGVEWGGPPGVVADASAGASQGAPGVRGPPEGPSSEAWVQYGVSLLAAMKEGGDSCAAALLQQLVALLYPLTSCLCLSRDAAGAAEVLETPEGAQCFSFLAALAAAAAEEEVKALTAAGAPVMATTPREGGDCSSVAAEGGPSSSTPNSNSSSSSSSVSGCPLLLELLGAYEGPLSLPGVAAAARGGPLRGLHKAAQRGAARLLGKAASLRDSAAAVSAWLVYHRLSSSSSSSSSSGDSSFSASNVRHLLALLIASVRNHLSRPLEQRVSALCLREALKEPRMQAALAGPTHDAALAFAAVCLQALQALVAAAETAAQETQLHAQDPPPPPTAAATAAAATAAAATRKQHLRAAAPISEMLALLCASSPALRASVAARLDTLPPPLQPLNGSSSNNNNNSSSGAHTDSRQQQQQQQQQQQASQVSPGRGRSSAALSSSSLPSLFYIAAWGDPLGCTYTSAFLELCLKSHGARDVGRHLTQQQREDAVAALAANTDLLQCTSTCPRRTQQQQQQQQLRQ
ncbi:hypothetical protein Emed_001911 [Eimeria media]